MLFWCGFSDGGIGGRGASRVKPVFALVLESACRLCRRAKPTLKSGVIGMGPTSSVFAISLRTSHIEAAWHRVSLSVEQMTGNGPIGP
jgi:hypothetical protein